jgi:uncharacterized protein YbaP (TraB family)
MKQLTLLFILSSFFASAQTESIFWKIEHPDIKKSSYLFGTYHMINNGFLEKDAAKANKVFKKSTTILVESRQSDLSDQTMMDKYFFEGPSIIENLTPEELTLVDSVTRKNLNAPLGNYDNIKPLLLAVFIGLTHHQDYLRDSGNYEGQPIDVFFDNDATEREIDVFSLESPQQSFEYSMDSISFYDQIEYLVENCKYDDKMYAIAGSMYESYRSNNVKNLLKATDDYTKLVSDLTDEFITVKRNKLWMPKILDELKKGNVFIAVGSLHLAYDYGLVALLREKGFTLTPLEIK